MANPFKAIWNGLKGLGKLIGKAFSSAEARGLTEAIFQQALALVREVALELIPNAAKREQTVSTLVSAHIPESIARLAVELAVQQVKAEVEKIPVTVNL